MRKKRSGFLTVVFSLIPGAGHMFMGFMKIGLSLMSAFFTVIFFAAWLEISPLLFILPMLWFYSFFDCINRRYSSDDEFYMLDDNYLFSMDKFNLSNTAFFKKQNLLIGVVLLLLGIYLLWKSIVSNLWRCVPQEIYQKIQDATSIFPQLILGAVIIIVGVKLIIGKKREDNNNV